MTDHETNSYTPCACSSLINRFDNFSYVYYWQVHTIKHMAVQSPTF